GGDMGPIEQAKRQASRLKVLADDTAQRVALLENRLAEDLAQQAATSQILRIIRETPGQVQPVFDTIASTALTLCRASSVLVCTFDGRLIRISALASSTPGGADAVRAASPRPPSRETASAR